jgi:uncharacterized protein DUF1707/cell wall-active antibiotic response 4TMS protein YvqF
MNLPEPIDPRAMRAADADRERVADVLREAVAQGRISFDELDERLDQAYSARTYADLEAVTRDLPASSAVTPAAAPGTSYPLDRIGGTPAATFSVAIMSSVKRRGTWVVPPSYTAFTLMGSVQLDLRQARFSEPEVTIQAYTLMGEVQIIVPDDIEVEVGGIGIMAAFDHSANGPGVPGAPRLKVTGLALMGSVDVKRVPAGNQPGPGRPMLSQE